MSVVYTITKKYLQYLQYLPIFNKSNKSLLYVPCIWRKRIMGLIKLSNRTLDTALLQYNSNHLKLHTSRSYTPQQLWWWIKIISRFNFSSKPYKTPIYWKCKIAISSLVKYQSQKKSIKLMWNLLNFPKFNFNKSDKQRQKLSPGLDPSELEDRTVAHSCRLFSTISASQTNPDFSATFPIQLI